MIIFYFESKLKFNFFFFFFFFFFCWRGGVDFFYKASKSYIFLWGRGCGGGGLELVNFLLRIQI